MIGEQVAAKAEEWIGVPVVPQGRVRAGVDCKGLVAGIAKELGLPEANSLEALAGDYGPIIPSTRLKAGLARLFDRVPTREPGDILLIKLCGKPQHLAICAPKQGHASRVIEALNVGPMQVRPFRRADAEIDSIWRWRDGH